MSASTRPSLYTAIKKVDGETEVTGYHVCPAAKAREIKDRQTAGGVTPADPACGAPTDMQCITQVVTERAPWAKREDLPPAPRPVVEFGVNEEPDYSGRSGDVVATFKIKAKYLRLGSVTEKGWCALKQAPITWIGDGTEGASASASSSEDG
ncbi:MAG: hypothetical protein AAFV19_12635 [Pseudomonadota bacterium]